MAHCAHCAVPEKSNQNKEAEEEEERRDRVKGPNNWQQPLETQDTHTRQQMRFSSSSRRPKVKQSVEILVPVWPGKHTAADSSSADGNKRQFMAPIRPLNEFQNEFISRMSPLPVQCSLCPHFANLNFNLDNRPLNVVTEQLSS